MATKEELHTLQVETIGKILAVEKAGAEVVAKYQQDVEDLAGQFAEAMSELLDSNDEIVGKFSYEEQYEAFKEACALADVPIDGDIAGPYARRFQRALNPDSEERLLAQADNATQN